MINIIKEENPPRKTNKTKTSYKSHQSSGKESNKIPQKNLTF